MSKAALLFILVVLFMLVLVDCTKKSPTQVDMNTVTDIDGNTYQTITIGNQVWMAENLKVTHYRDGTSINKVTIASEWANLLSGAYCAYENNDTNAVAYGYLYNWYAISDEHNISPIGWHVPTDEEWKELEMYLGMSRSEADGTAWRGTDEGNKLKDIGTSPWLTHAIDDSGFAALPGGSRYFNGIFYFMGSVGTFWTATAHSTYGAWFRKLDSNHSEIYRLNYSLDFGFSVRLVKDN